MTRNPLAAIFSPTRQLSGPDAAIVQRGGLLGSVERVVPRADCHYRRLDFASLPARQRAAAARIAATRHAPSAEALSHIAWTGGIAHLWFWPTPDPGLVAGEVRWLPESLLRARPAADGPRLLRMVRGFEGQHWRDGQLVASQWWPQVPDLEAWRRFLRACGLDAEPVQAVPAALSEPWRDAPWGDVPRLALGSPATLERLAWTSGLAVLALALGWQVAAKSSWASAHEALQSRIDAVRSRATPLLDARERAETARAGIDALRALQESHNDYALMAEAIALLPEDARFAAWEREGERLQVSVRSADTDPRRFVGAFAKHPLLSDVAASPAEAGVMRLDFTLPGGAPQSEAVQ